MLTRPISKCMKVVPKELTIYNKLSNRGREPVIVYIIIYIPACIRSGWYPHPKIKNNVGIRENSNIK